MTEAIDTLPVTKLRGVGAQREAQLAKLGITTIEDLLRHYPRDYLDLSAPVTLDAAPLGQICAVRARVVRKHGETRIRGGMTLYKVTVGDEVGTMEVTFFNNPYAVQALKDETEYLFYSRIEGTLLRRTMASPLVFPAESSSAFAPCYPLTKGLSSRMLSALVKQALEYAAALPEPLPEEIRREHELIDLADAVQEIHFPSCADALAQARHRLMFEELFLLAAGVGLLGSRKRACRACAMRPHSLDAFYSALPFTLTDAQRRAIDQLTADMTEQTPASRLVQGDVGSGKTMVAAAGAYFAFLSGAQTAMMAPTELLARQHYTGLAPLLAPLGVRVGLLVGAMTAAQKRVVHAQLAAGEIDFCIGTHALLSQGVAFARLGLVVTDEQHRFGVAQRAALQQKGETPHTLVMSATPIPRTLALMIYGELDVSIIDQLPPGRMPVKTYKISTPKRERAFGFIREHLAKGRQAYIVCPLVEAGEELPGLRAATEYFEQLREESFAQFRLGLLHGKMKPKDKDVVMSAFAAGEIQLLIATTVIEVGVDVPNAAVMMIENAERFGLSQLHQLRGRVGRGREQAHCILLSDSRSPDTIERLKMLCQTTDGFALAEYDLRTRGPGNFLGRQQHGLPSLRIADLTTDTVMVTQAQQAAQGVLADDPALESPMHQPLAAAVSRLMQAVGDRPN